MASTIQEQTPLCIIDHENKEIVVYSKAISDSLSFLGDGISNFEANSFLTTHWIKNRSITEWQNEIKLTFYDEPWGGIGFERWKYAEEILEKLVNKNAALYSYLINVSKNRILLTFEVEYQMGVY
jgi:hypothetical protein